MSASCYRLNLARNAATFALLTGIAQQAGLAVIARSDVADLMVNGFGELALALEEALDDNDSLGALGIAVESVRVDELKPTPELERALQTPTRESLQQRADEATFKRRALAVEKERAIAENELQRRLAFFVREAFPSVATSAEHTEGIVEGEDALVIIGSISPGGCAPKSASPRKTLRLVQ